MRDNVKTRDSRRTKFGAGGVWGFFSGDARVNSERWWWVELASNGRSTSTTQPILPQQPSLPLQTTNGNPRRRRVAQAGKDIGEMSKLRKKQEDILNRVKKRMGSARMPDYSSKKRMNYRTYKRKDGLTNGRVPRMRNDSKPGGLSRSRMWGRKHPKELGGLQGHKRPYRERLDRPFSFNDNDNEPLV